MLGWKCSIQGQFRQIHQSMHKLVYSLFGALFARAVLDIPCLFGGGRVFGCRQPAATPAASSAARTGVGSRDPAPASAAAMKMLRMRMNVDAVMKILYSSCPDLAARAATNCKSSCWLQGQHSYMCAASAASHGHKSSHWVSAAGRCPSSRLLFKRPSVVWHPTIQHTWIVKNQMIMTMTNEKKSI